MVEARTRCPSKVARRSGSIIEAVRGGAGRTVRDFGGHSGGARVIARLSDCTICPTTRVAMRACWLKGGCCMTGACRACCNRARLRPCAGGRLLGVVRLGDKGSALSSRVGSRLRYFRQRAGISQQELHIRSDVSLAHISRIENGTGNPTVQMLEALASGAGCTIVDLVQDAEPEDG